MIPDPLVITVHRPPNPDHDVVTYKNAGESESEHVHRACKDALKYVKDNPVVNKVSTPTPREETIRESGQSDEDLLDLHDAKLQEDI